MRQGRSLNDLLATFAIALIVPLLAFSGFVLWQYTTAERERADRMALESARGLARDVERELASLVTVLQVLAQSAALAGNDLGAFHDQAAAVAASVGSPILLRDLEGRQLINTRLPKGAALPQDAADPITPSVVTTRRPHVSDLVMDAVAQRQVVAVAAPVIGGGDVRSILLVSLAPERLLPLLRDQDLGEAWTLAISDRGGRIIARSKDQAAFLGRQSAVRELSPGRDGVHRIAALSGEAVLRGYAYLPDGWLVAVFTPAVTVDAPLRASWAIFLAVGLGVLVLALPLALGFARRIAEPIAQMAASSAMLGRGEAVPLVQSNIRETNAVGRALHQASQELIARASALAESEARFRSIFEQAAVGFDQFSLAGARIGINDRLCEMLGYSREECLKLKWGELSHAEETEQELPLLEKLVRGEIANYVVEKRVKKKSGDWMWVRATVSLARDANGKPIHRIAVVEDISERRKARAAAARLAAVVQVSSAAIFSTSVEGAIETWNPAAEKLFGYTEEEIVGQSKAILVPPKRRAELVATLKRVRDGETFSHESVRLRKDGSRVAVSIGLSPIRGAGGVVSAISVTMEDITERKRWEQQIALLNRELQHRVKNSLAVVQSIANQTARANADPERFREAFEGRLRALAAANDLLALSDQGGAWIEEFVDRQLTPLLSAPAQQLRKSGPALALPSALTVPLALALHELGTNALKYGSLSTPGGHVEISWRRVVVEGEAQLVLVWREAGGPAVAEPARRGFGSTLIERGIPGARVEWTFEPGGLACELAIPLGPEP